MVPSAFPTQPFPTRLPQSENYVDHCIALKKISNKATDLKKMYDLKSYIGYIIIFKPRFLYCTTRFKYLYKGMF